MSEGDHEYKIFSRQLKRIHINLDVEYFNHLGFLIVRKDRKDIVIPIDDFLDFVGKYGDFE